MFYKNVVFLDVGFRNYVFPGYINTSACIMRPPENVINCYCNYKQSYSNVSTPSNQQINISYI